MPKVMPIQVRLRKSVFDTAECEYCRYFNGSNNSGSKIKYGKPYEGETGFCGVLEGQVGEYYVCDAYQGDEKRFKAYEVADEDVAAFARGMRKLQPYKHFVVRGLDTPVGFLLIIRDSMRPKPHYFSLDMAFSLEHTSKEHHWTQGEADNLIRVGRGK